MENNNNENNNNKEFDKNIEKLKYLSICKGKIINKFEKIISKFNNYNNDIEKANEMFNELKNSNK